MVGDIGPYKCVVHNVHNVYISMNQIMGLKGTIVKLCMLSITVNAY